MKIKSLLFALIVASACQPVLAQTPAAAAPTAPVPPHLDARAWLLLDTGSNQILTSEKPDMRAEPASLTKLMTAYVVFNALKSKAITLDQTVPVSENAWRMVKSGSAMFIEPRKPVTVRELLQGVIVQSGNDACIALAELVAGSEANFVVLMNREAQRLGLANTQFRNATGLTESGHYSSPRDMASIAAAIIRDHAEFFPIYSQKEFRYNKINQPNRNRLLWLDPTVDGMKTGHTDAAGYCLVSTARRGPRRLISVVMGTASDNARTLASQQLLNFGFLNFDSVRFYGANQPVRKLQVWQGQQDEVEVGVAQDLVLAVPRDRSKDVKLQFDAVTPVLKAPVSKGAALGRITLSLDGKSLGEFPVVALQDVAQAGIVGRSVDAVKLWFR
ncbi:D-alanyl-D-alanine carboxypeptidase family protein [Viridibacterium curvum]|uniref:serine-type D-Ala-D-Ala carboxypeptidase n=1 Tax=Viridibacterium curvum TaxID=1101404 RepID=A0ABP9QPL1_9RHOO